MKKLITVASSANSANRRVHAKDKILKLNVGGKRYMLLRSCLTDYPDTVLGKLANMPIDNIIKYGLWDAYIEEDHEIYFNRPSALFTPVAQFYQTGHVHNVPGICPAAMREELQFWGIYPKYVSTFCRMCLKKNKSTISKDKLFNSSMDGSLTNTDIDSANGFNYTRSYPPQSTANGDIPSNLKKQSMSNGGTPHKKLSNHTFDQQLDDHLKDLNAEPELDTVRQQIWSLLEGTTSNRISMILNFVSILFILLNIALIILDSLPHFHYTVYANFEIFNITHHKAQPDSSNLTAKAFEAQSVEDSMEEDYETEAVQLRQDMERGHLTYTSTMALYTLDWLCTAVFTFEFIVKVWCAPQLCLFLRQPMTIIDVLAIFPPYFETIANLLKVHHGGSLSVLQVIRIFRAFRVFRIMKLAKYESSFKVLGNCLKDCIPEFVLLFVYLFMATLLFGTMLFYAEGEVEDTFYSSIPEAIWWSIVTYFSFADAPPKTLFGKTVAALASIAGVVLMALPVSVIVDKFSTFLNDFRRRKQLSRASSMNNMLSSRQLETNFM